jgi:hypothetical protein
MLKWNFAIVQWLSEFNKIGHIVNSNLNYGCLLFIQNVQYILFQIQTALGESVPWYLRAVKYAFAKR